jgi:hypothetical protein
MLGPAKPRHLGQPIAVSLEALVPHCHFYRYLDARLDLSFVRDWVGDAYPDRGRPSIDPIAYFKLYLVMFFEASVRSANCSPWPRIASASGGTRRRPGRGAARCLRLRPHPPTPRARRLPPLLRARRRHLPGGGPRLGEGGPGRRDPRPRQRVHGFPRAQAQGSRGRPPGCPLCGRCDPRRCRR